MATLQEQIASLTLPDLSEEQFAKYLGLSLAQYKTLKTPITDDQRAFIEQARAIETLAPLWQSGVEPYPSDVSVNRGRKPVKQRTPRHER